MQTLDGHNKQTCDAYWVESIYPKNNGIECPKCKHELQDTNSNVLCSNPPQYNVNCSNCDYTGYRF